MVAAPSRSKLVVAFAIVYLVWGSTYLAIRWAVESIPPLLMAGSRFLVAGIILGLVTYRKGTPRPTRREFAILAGIGFCMLLAGNGFLTIAETSAMPTGVGALLIASVPLWMVVLEAVTGVRPTLMAGVGLILGFAGVALLGFAASSGGDVDWRYVLLILLGSAAWAAGSLASRHSGMKLPMLQAVAWQMAFGGAFLLVFGALHGEHARLSTIGWRAGLSWLYLVLAGSVLAFSAYSWLLRAVPAGVATTYAFVNPLVAVVIGSLVLSEPITLPTIVASALIIGAVATITVARSRSEKRRIAEQTPPAA